MTVFYDDGRLTLLHGDAIEQVRALDSGSVQTVVTSPPYFGLRDYGTEGQYGSEESVTEFVNRLVALFREARRVLADDGTLWLNLGDSYAGTGYGNHSINGEAWKEEAGLDRRTSRQQVMKQALLAEGIAPKNLIGVPWRVALALQSDGWVLRSDIIWHKPRSLPESVTDRPTKAHEYLFLLAKSAKYYYDAAAIAEPVAAAGGKRTTKGYDTTARYGAGNGGNGGLDSLAARMSSGEHSTRNKRSVWSVSPTSFPGAHFATFPPELIRPCIRAGSRPGDTVLDPFSGSGTTGMVALQEGRKYVGIDINRDYLELSLRERFNEQPLDLYGATA